MAFGTKRAVPNLPSPVPQGIMSLSEVTTIPVAALFLFAQSRVVQGMTKGAVKG
jgi:ABC-type glycerol-3-phosphate transport system permease component